MKASYKIASNTIYQIIGKIVNAAITFFITLILARSFGIRQFGQYIQITSYVAIFYLLVDFGFNAIFLQKIQKQPTKENFYFQNLLSLRVFFALFLTLVAVLLAVILPYNPLSGQGFSNIVKVGIFIVSITILMQAVFVSCNLIFQRNLRYDKSVWATIGGNAISLAVLVLLIRLGTALLWTMFSLVIGYIVTAFLALRGVEIFRRIKYETEIDFSLWKRMIVETLPLGIIFLFNLIYFRVDALILSLFRTTEEVGIYGLAYKIFETPLVLPIFLMNAVYPIMLSSKFKVSRQSGIHDVAISHSSKASSGQSSNLRIVRKSFFVLSFLSFIFIILFFFLSPLLSYIKPEFEQSILPLRILSLSFPFFFLTPVFMWFLIACGKQKLLAIVYGASLALNILLNLVFIPKYGYIASAVITGIGEGVLFIILILSTWNYYKDIELD
ncbi:oligosaccharide flippase family protein [Candidatus Gottesmanbacteria bacterium]|nr:oligosaccharide flippase family protein [Candidatus Gottesmanbacteria bacterium]